MIINKLFLRWIAVCGWLIALSVQSWGVCPTPASSMGTWNATSGSTYNNHSGTVQSDDADYYTITNPVGGQINLSVTNNSSNRQLTATLYSDATCSATSVWTSGVMAGGSSQSATINVTAGTTYYLYLVGGASNQDTSYTFSANKPVKGHALLHENPFSPVFGNDGLKLFGDFTSTGNSVLCQNNGSGGCNNNYNGYLYDSNVIYKNEGSMTLNSASSILTLPANITGVEIQWAGLYWQGHIADQDAAHYTSSTKVQERGNVSFRLPDGTTQDLSADRVWYHDFWGDGTGQDGGFRSFYQGYKDVTSLVKSHLVNGTSQSFTVGNIKANSGQDWYSYLYVGPGAEYDGIKFGFWGNWSLIVVYKYDAASMPSGTKLKNINVFNGFDAMIPLPVTGYETSNVVIPISGFLTPKSGTVNAEMLFYASGGEKLIQRDAFYIQNANAGNAYQTVSNTLNPANNPFNGSVSIDGSPINSAISYYPGMDLDTFNVSSYMKNNQSTTSLKLEATFSNSNGDQSTPGVIAFSTDLYTPSFCYDYGYEQNGLPFTEENNGTAMPYITGVLPNTSDIAVRLYIRNQENSDVSANNVFLNISDINSTQVIYKRDSVGVTYPNQYTPTYKTDAAWPVSVSDTNINNIPLGNIGGKGYAYTYYSLIPQRIGSIRAPIRGSFSYDLVIPLANGTSLTLPYSATIGGTGLPMCSGENFSYTPEWGIFSVVDAGLYDSATNANNTSGKKYYDLTTQVVKRPGNFRIASFEPANLDKPKAVTTIVAVEMIDASPFHDVDAACREPSSAISPRVWMSFENNVSQVSFNAATIQNAINNGMVSDVITGQPSPITLASDFFKTATPNAAFRVTFNTLADQNDSLIHIQQTSQGIRIDNFSNVHQVYPHCQQYVINPNNSGTTNLTSVACSDNGNHSTYRDVAICLECLYGARTQVLCSRDNFAIRPESYTVTLKDMNQTNHTVAQVFAPGYNGVLVPNTGRIDVASGYTYGVDINATNHLGNAASPGYTRYFGTGGQDYNITLVWEPSSTKTGCNDINSKPQNINVINGTVNSEANLSQVGEYRLNVIDKTWTAVDWDSMKQLHQSGTHFLSGAECGLNSHDVPMQSSAVTLAGTTLGNLVGCDISSTHDNVDTGLKYRDYLLTFHPYKFDMSTIGFGTGILPTTIASGGKGFSYMSKISRDDSMDMSLRATGNIKAAGYDNLVNSNFVKNCYAKDLNLSMISKNNLTHPQGAKYQIRFRDYNSSDTNTTNLIYDSNATNINTSGLVMKLTSIADTNFTKSTAGSLYTVSRLNYDRNVTVPLTPITAQFSEFDVKCLSTTECKMQADLSATHQALGAKTMDFNVTYAYGRINPLDVRVFGNVDFTANGWYEVYQVPMLAGNVLAPSRNAPLWFINRLHDDNNDGNSDVTIISPNTLALPVNSDMMNPPNQGMETYSFTKIGSGNIPYSGKAHINTDPWLWYGVNALDYIDPSSTNLNCQTHPCFNINIVPDIGRAGSATEVELRSNKINKATSKTRVQYDYTPATR
ncbi:MAG: hypothetical protein CJD30_02765 [Sulfuricurvum sp. PD_MW2]|jgi:hypothetical protein|uniref:hypothetical protein n=1 Tax=Sulfuricurvum sp. PD_MW2 TaxID=2027917 RepID=UPI000C063DC4|nr:hypothetical protein [Sulfuricurvum sp. PD_MW2]PHM18119.1 MAG: hypothetical protein CJD30_02765 [Sulfuricurvum sp. PD_MW2]